MGKGPQAHFGKENRPKGQEYGWPITKWAAAQSANNNCVKITLFDKFAIQRKDLHSLRGLTRFTGYFFFFTQYGERNPVHPVSPV